MSKLTGEFSGAIKNEVRSISLRQLTVLGLLTACEIVLSRFLSVSIWNFKFGFAFIPIVIAAYLFGPLSGALVGGLADFVGAVMFPIGAYFPGFTLTAALTGLCFGLMLSRRRDFSRIAAAASVTQLFGSLLLNTYWISVLYGKAFIPLLPLRALQAAGMIAAELLIIPAILLAIEKSNIRLLINKYN